MQHGRIEHTPSKETLRKFGFFNINLALANTVQANLNEEGPIMSNISKKDVSREELTAIIKEKINKEQQQLKIILRREVRTMQEAILAVAIAYTDSMTSDLGDCITLQFEELINNIKTTQKILKDPNQHLVLSNSS